MRHEINAGSLEEWETTAEIVYASTTEGGRIRLCVTLGGAIGYTVRARGALVYSGHDRQKAVDAFNNALRSSES